MSGEATLAQSAAILKTRYPDGRLPKANYQNFKLYSALSKKEDFVGENKVVAIQTENPQGASADFPTAVSALQQGTYNRFTVTPIDYFSLARIRGNAIKRASSSAGALVDLWKNETDGASQTAIKSLETYCFGNGTGVLGTLDGSSTVTATSVPLGEASQAVYFDIGMTLQAVDSATSLSPTIRSGTAKVIGIDRVNGVIQFGDASGTPTNLDTLIPTVANTDSLVRSGTAASGGTPKVVTGIQQWVAGGATPGTLFGLNRNSDPVRLAGQVLDLTGVGMEDALIEMEGKLIVQGFGADTLVAWVNPLDIKELKKALGGKVTYPKTEMKSAVAGLSFKGLEFEGDNGPIKLMSNPFCPKGQVMMCDMSQCAFESAGPAPHLQNYDSLNTIRITDDDVWQVQFATYGQLFVYMPVKFIRGTSWGAV